MGLTLQIKWPASLQGKGKIEEIEKLKPSLLKEGGVALQELIKEWMVQLQSARSRHSPPHFTPDDVLDPVVDGNYVKVPITTKGITRALHDIVINPKEAQSLAIPLHASAYGMQPRDYNIAHPKGTPEALFKPKGKDYLAKNENGSLVVMYLLRKSVHQKQDRTLLPTADAMVNTFMEAISDAVGAILTN